MEGWQNGNAPLLKSGGRKPLEVRVLYPPPGARSIVVVRPPCTRVAGVRFSPGPRGGRKN